MSYKLPFFSSFSDLLNYNNSENNEENIVDNNVLKLCLRNTNESLLRYFQSTTLTVGYINNRFRGIRDTGSFIITINTHERGPSAIYCISRSDPSKYGLIKELVKSNGAYEDTLDLTWSPFEYPLLKFRTKLEYYKNKTVINFYVNVTSSF